MNLRLYKPYGIFDFGWRSTFPGAEPPAGPPKISKSLGETTFPKIWSFFTNFGPMTFYVGKVFSAENA